MTENKFDPKHKTIPYVRFSELAQKNKELRQRNATLEKEKAELKAQIEILERILVKLKATR